MGFLILLLILLLVITNLPLIGDACVFTKVLSHLILILTFVHARPVLVYSASDLCFKCGGLSQSDFRSHAFITCLC
jgi:hypothetical protein